MKIVGIIPARYASTRFPGKPLALLKDKPLIQHVYERAKQSEILDLLVVATDDQRIFSCVKRFGGEALMTSPQHSCGTERLAEAAEILGLSEDDLVVNVQGDQPFIEPQVIEDLVRPLILDPQLSMSTLAFPIEKEEEISNPNRVKVVMDNQGRALYFSRSPIPFYRSPGPKPTYFRHIGIYAYRKIFLDEFLRLTPGKLEQAEKLEQLRVLEHGFSIAVVITNHDCPEVDTPEDLARLEKRAFIFRIP